MAVYSSFFSVYFPVTNVKRHKRMCSSAHAHLVRVRKLARALSLAESQHNYRDIEYHAAYTKTNFPRVLHFSACYAACMLTQ